MYILFGVVQAKILITLDDRSADSYTYRTGTTNYYMPAHRIQLQFSHIHIGIIIIVNG